MSHTEGMTLCAEQRKAIRYACILDATANERTVRLGSGWVARVVDISTTGIGLHVGESLPAGALLTLDLEGRCHSLKAIKVRVMRCLEHADGSWFLGASLLTPLDEVEMERLIS